MRDTVYVFARAPRLGTVKRRLARGIGDRAALHFYTKTLFALLRALAADPRFRTRLAVTPDRGRVRLPYGVDAISQGPGDLGARMHHVCARHRRGRVVIVGSDIPDLRARDVADAFRQLRRAQSCFGPATDGGYWLVGLSARRPSCPFANVRWSTEHALADTVANQGRRRVALLRQLSDVDEARDLPTPPRANVPAGAA